MALHNVVIVYIFLSFIFYLLSFIFYLFIYQFYIYIFQILQLHQFNFTLEITKSSDEKALFIEYHWYGHMILDSVS